MQISDLLFKKPETNTGGISSTVRWKARIAVTSIAGICVAGFWFYIHRNDPLRVRSLEIVDAKGKVCAVLGPSANGQSGLVLKDKQGIVRSEFTVDEAGLPCLMLFDSQGSIRAQMSVTKNDRSTLRLADQHGLTRMEMEVNKQGASFLKLHDSHSFRTNYFACDDNGDLQKLPPLIQVKQVGNKQVNGSEKSGDGDKELVRGTE